MRSRWRFGRAPISFVVRIPVGRRGSIELLRNNQRRSLTNCRNPFEESGLWPRTVTLEAAVFDRRVQVAIDGRLLFDPFDFDDPVAPGLASESPLALGVRGGALEVSESADLSRHLLHRARWPTRRAILTGCRRPSSWARTITSCWATIARFPTIRGSGREGPVVRGSMFVGKPFLVHLPGQVVPLKVFGRSVCWVPDPRRIRYIR